MGEIIKINRTNVYSQWREQARNGERREVNTMAKGKKTGGKTFAIGNKCGGRKSLPEDIKAARNQSYEDMCRTVIEVRLMTPGEIKKIDLEKMPLGQRAIMNAYVKLDYRGIKDYEDRLWGKAQDKVQLTGLDEEMLKIEIIGVRPENKDTGHIIPDIQPTTKI